MFRVEARGLRLELLAARAMESGARFKQAERVDKNTMLFLADRKSANILMRMAERHSIPCRVLEQTGFDRLAALFLRRWTLLAGLVLFCALMLFFQSRLWRVEVHLRSEREMTVSQEEILAILDRAGVVSGMPKREVDTDFLEALLIAGDSRIAFAGVEIHGSDLVVEIVPTVENPEVYDLDRAHDLVSAFDGIVVSIDAQTGMPAVKPGDVVRRGDVLIRGEERISKEETRGIAALGSVVVRTWVTGEGSLPLTQERMRPTGEKSTVVRLACGPWEFPLAEGKHFPLETEETEFLPVGGLFLPVKIVRTTRHAMESITEEVDTTSLQGQLSEQLFREIDAEIANFGTKTLEIVDKWAEFAMIEEELYAYAAVELLCQAACTPDALSEGG